VNRIASCSLACAVLLQASASAIPALAQAPADLGASVATLAASVERLATLLEKDLALRSEERNARQVDTAVAILGLRYRKIDQLEREIQGISREDEEFSDHMAMMRVEVERLDTQGRAESGQLSDEMKAEIAQMELQIKLQEDRMARLRDQRLVLQNDLTAERRRLSRVEAILDSWLEKLE